jgi:hypothetical protein
LGDFGDKQGWIASAVTVNVTVAHVLLTTCRRETMLRGIWQACRVHAAPSARFKDNNWCLSVICFRGDRLV